MIELNGESLTIEQVVAVARDDARVAPLSDAVRARMQATHDWVMDAIYRDGAIIYGVSTGFGPLARQRIAPDQARQLSRNLILNCACGVGDPLPEEIVRAMMLIRANTLAKGFSGVRPLVAQTLIEMLNARVTPFVPSKGSLGASGDLAPLAHIAVVLTRGEDGESGRAWFEGAPVSGADAMQRAHIERLVPEAKEGLALTNGTTFMVAAGALAIHDAAQIAMHAEIAAALSMEALRAQSSAFHPALHEANGQLGQMQTAANLCTLFANSRLIDSDGKRIQDAYSVRCTPQVIGPMRDLIAFLRERMIGALNAASDNPLIVRDGSRFRAVSGGNFHGQGPALWLDTLGIALAAVGNIAERRVFRLLTPELNDGLPAMLAPNPGLDSGLMVSQYTAAALVSDNKTLAHPDSVDSIPSSANQEDHVSMGANAARHAREIVVNVRHIIAIELLTAVQAIDLRDDGAAKLGRGTSAAYQRVRARVAFLTHDRSLTADIESLAELIRSGEILNAVGETLGENGWTRI